MLAGSVIEQSERGAAGEIKAFVIAVRHRFYSGQLIHAETAHADKRIFIGFKAFGNRHRKFDVFFRQIETAAVDKSRSRHAVRSLDLGIMHAVFDHFRRSLIRGEPAALDGIVLFRHRLDADLEFRLLIGTAESV